MQDTTAPALSRTWRTHNSDKMDGAVIHAHSHTVTLSREFIGGPLAATVDGEAADVTRALVLLEDAHTVEVLAEVLAPLPAPVIGKARAHKLHKLLGCVPCDHYGIAGRALGRQVYSLAALTEAEARKVWAFVRFMFPDFFPTAA